MVLSADERRELRRLLDKMDSADGVQESDTAAMTDGAKRLRDDLGGYPETGSAGSSGMSAGSQMPVTKPVKGRGSTAAKKAAAEVPNPSEEEEIEEVIVVNYTGTEEVVPLPTGISLTEWDLKVVAQTEWKGKSYSALVALSRDDNNLATYLTWVKEKFGKDYEGGKPRSQAVDFAGYLKRVGFSKEKGPPRKAGWWQLVLPNWRGDFCQCWQCYKQWELESWPVSDWMGATVRDLGLALGGMFSFWHGKRVGSLVRTNKQAGIVLGLRMWLLRGCERRL